MKTKKYYDVFKDATDHPKAEKFAEEVRARIYLKNGYSMPLEGL